jgi:hypothetical protein
VSRPASGSRIVNTRPADVWFHSVKDDLIGRGCYGRADRETLSIPLTPASRGPAQLRRLRSPHRCVKDLVATDNRRDKRSASRYIQCRRARGVGAGRPTIGGWEAEGGLKERGQMPAFMAAARSRPAPGRDISSGQIRRPKNGSCLKLARGSIIACCSICGAFGAVIAEERQAVPNYKELIHGAVRSSFVDPSSIGLIEISPLHPSRAPQAGDWTVCLRIVINGQPTLYAAFINSQPPTVILLRQAVRFDDCGQDQYEPLSSAPPVQDRPPGPPRKK